MRARKILPAAASLALAAGLGAGMLATAGTAHAATPSCGSSCLDIFSHQFGTFAHPDFVLDVFKQHQAVGQPVILFRVSNSDPAEDWTVSAQGTVNDFHAASLVSNAIWLHYGAGACKVNTTPCPAGKTYPNDYAIELEYAPYGADTGLCMGVGSTAVAGTKVALEPCGVSAKTTWVIDTLDSCFTNPLYSLELPLINGSDTNFSHPFVLTYPSSSFPTDQPRPQLFMSNLNGFSQSGSGACGGGSITGPNTNQLWAAKAGVLS